ncbi:MAG: LysR family transcriptional regulator [Actinobacteria bacterium]|nr:LysR family transcriptional regulator [Actinomycetota bacterium]
MRRRPDVTLTQLRYFVKAATYSSMTKAADELHIAQSAVSAAVGQLEQQIGTQLFIRHRARGLVLTAAGEEMLRDTRALLAHLDEVLDAAGGHVDQVHGTVRLACFVTLAPFVLPRLLSDLGERHPELAVEVIETPADAVRSVLRNGTADLALTYDLGLGPGVEVEHLGVAAPYVALPPDHRLARRKSIPLAELAEEPMVLLDLPESRDYFESILAKAGVAPRIRYRSASYETVRGLVARGHGFSILNQMPAHRETYDGGAVTAVAIRDDLPGLPIVLARLQAVRTTARVHAVSAAARAIFAQDNGSR